MTKQKANTAARLGGMLTSLTEQSSGAFPTFSSHDVVAQVVSQEKRRYVKVPLDHLRPNPNQPRKFFDEPSLRDLGESIKEHGLQQPLIIREANAASMYDIAAGERRWRAMRLMEMTETDAIEIIDCSDDDLETIALIENLHRTNLSPYELAEAYWRLHRTTEGAVRMSIADVAGKMKQSKDSVDSHLAIMRVPSKVRQLIIDDPTIPLRTIRDLGQVENPDDLDFLIEEVRSHRYTANDISRMLRQVRKAQTRPAIATGLSENEGSTGFQGQETEKKAFIIAPTDHTEELKRPISPAAERAFPVEERRETAETKSLAKETKETRKVSPALALAALETRLKREDSKLQQIVRKIAEDVPFMDPDEKGLVKNQTQTWLVLIQQILEQIQDGSL